jgi:hypothetical protein
MKASNGFQFIGSALIGAAAVIPQSPAWSAPELSTSTANTTIQPTAITLPKTADFPGSGITLTQPVNVLQPIPPAASKLPSPLN